MADCTFVLKNIETPVPVEGRCLEEIAVSLGVNPDAHIFLRGSVPVPMTLVPDDGDRIRALAVASGG